MNAQTAHTPTRTDLILRGLEYCMDWKNKKPDAITFATALADAHQHIIDSERENAQLVEHNERMRQALQELHDLMQYAQNDDPSGFHRLGFDSFTLQAARAALNPPPTK